MVTFNEAAHIFLDELHQVDPTTKVLVDGLEVGVDDLDAMWSPDRALGGVEFTYSASATPSELAINGGSRVGVELGLSHALHAWGFRWPAPFGTSQKIPPIRPDLLSPLAPTTSEMHVSEVALGVSGGPAGGWGRPDLAEAAAITADEARWRRLNGWHNSQMLRVVRQNYMDFVIAHELFFADHPNARLYVGDPFDISDPNKTPNPLKWTINIAWLLDPVNKVALDEAVDLAAAWLVTTQYDPDLPPFLAFDATDSDPHDASQIVEFSAHVSRKVRQTPQSGGPRHPLTGARISVLAYSNRHDPPDPSKVSFTQAEIRSLLHVMVTTAYGRRFPLLVLKDWAEWADELSIYDYWDLPAWFNCQPIDDRTTKADYLEQVLVPLLADIQRSDGSQIRVRALQVEPSQNWLQLIVHHHRIRHFRVTGQLVANDTAIDELVAGIFNNDDNVRQILQLWSDPSTYRNSETLFASATLASNMDTGSWWRTAFQEILVIALELFELEGMPDEFPDWTWTPKSGALRMPVMTSLSACEAKDRLFERRLLEVLGHSHSLKSDGVFHSWAFQQRLAANGHIDDNFPAFSTHRAESDRPDPRPPVWTETSGRWLYSWRSFWSQCAPVDASFIRPSSRPTERQFGQALAKISHVRASSRPADELVVADDLVMVEGLTPSKPRLQADSLRFGSTLAGHTWTSVIFVATDPGAQVDIARNNTQRSNTEHVIRSIACPLVGGQPTRYDLDAGIGLRLEPQGGYLFYSCYPGVFLGKDAKEKFPGTAPGSINLEVFNFFYIPKTYKGQTRISCDGAFTFWRDIRNNHTINSASPQAPQDFGPGGQLTIVRSAGSGITTFNGGVNRWVSVTPDRALMSRDLANAEGLNFVKLASP